MHGEQEKYRAKDGHVLDSKAEKKVDDKLYEWGLAHMTHPKLSWSDREWVGDFLVDGVYVEVLGDDGRLHDNWDEKKECYEENEKPLVVIKEKDLEDGKSLHNKIEEIKEKRSQRQITLDEIRMEQPHTFNDGQQKIPEYEKRKREVLKRFPDLKKEIEALRNKLDELKKEKEKTKEKLNEKKSMLTDKVLKFNPPWNL